MASSKRSQSESKYHNEVFSGGSGKRVLSSKFYTLFSLSSEYYEGMLQSIVNPNSSVLEFGCGLGTNCPKIEEIGAKYFGIDISEVGIKKASQQYGDYFEVMDCENPTLNQKFDVVFGNSILHHLDSIKARDAICNLLHNSGEFLFLEPMGYNPLINLYRYLTPNERTPDEHPFLFKDFRIYEEKFQLQIKYFHLFDLLSIPLRGRIKKQLQNIDSIIEPYFRKWFWICIIRGKKC